MKVDRESAFALLDAVARIVLGAIFIYAAWSKMQDPSLFASAVSGYQMLPAPLVAFVAIVLPPAELIAGAALILTKWQRESALLILGMLAVFLVGLVQAEVRGLDIGCGCFGGEDDDTVMGAIIRDISLLVPAVWLVVRRNRPAWGWKIRIPAIAAIAATLVYASVHQQSAARHRPTHDGKADGAAAENPQKPQKTAEEAIAEIFAQVPDPDTNSVAAEVWTRNFPGALAKARAEKRPLVIVVDSKSCPFCKKLEKAFANAGFAKWLDGTGLYLANGIIESSGSAKTNSADMAVTMYQFIDDSPHNGKIAGYPYVGVYWEKPSGETLWTGFCGRHGLMNTKFKNSLACEFTDALVKLLPEYFAGLPPRPSESEMLSVAAKQIKVIAEGEGTVTMDPPHGTLIDDGGRITAIAKPGKGWKFARWRGPSGKPVRERLGGPHLAISYSMQGGTYTAVFKKKPKSAAKKNPRSGIPGLAPKAPPPAKPAPANDAKPAPAKDSEKTQS